MGLTCVTYQRAATRVRGALLQLWPPRQSHAWGRARCSVPSPPRFSFHTARISWPGRSSPIHRCEEGGGQQ